MNADYQDVYRARVWAENSILITFPAWECSLPYNRDIYEAGLKATNALVGTIDALDGALCTHHDDLNGNQESEYNMQRVDKNKHVLLEFNDDTILLSKLIYTHDKQEDETKLPTFTFDKEYRINNPGKVNSQSNVIFVVTIDGKPIRLMRWPKSDPAHFYQKIFYFVRLSTKNRNTQPVIMQ